MDRERNLVSLFSHQIQFPLGFCPDPLGELTALPRSLAEFKGSTSRGEREWREGRK